ncbi:MAG: type II secretion system protein GspD [Armatimonadota bacterium]
MRLHLIAALVIASSLCARAARAETLEIIDLMHLGARDMAVAFAGGGASAADVLGEEAADFAVTAMREAAQRSRGSAGATEPIVFSRGRSVPGGPGDLSHLLPDGLAGPPVAAPNRNALVVRGSREAIDELRELIAMLDVPTPMVNVELTMVATQTSQVRRLDPLLHRWDFVDLSLGGAAEPVLGLHSGDVAALLGYEAGWTRRRASTAANVTGMSAQPMLISAGEVRPRTVSEVYYDPWGRRQVQYYVEGVFVGVTFWVLPTVNADDTVTMILRPMLSEVVGRVAHIGAGDVVRRTLVETTVRVPDGEPLVIGGLDRRADELSRAFPASSGALRTSGSSVITVTPRIIRVGG